MKSYWKFAVAASAVILMAAGDTFARPRGGGVRRPGGGVTRPGIRPATGQRPGARPAAGTRPGTGARPGAGTVRPGVTRPGTGAAKPGQRPTSGQLRQHLNLPGNAKPRAQQVRRGLNHRWAHPGHHRPYTAAWYARHPGAGRVRHPWAVATWVGLAAWVGVASQPVAYGYGGYGDTVYYPSEGQADENAAAYQEEVQQANQLADAGQKAAGAETNEADWMPVGVFALMPNGQSQSNATIQLSISKQGVVKGSYYDMLTDTVQPVAGSVDKKTQMVAWSLESNKSVVYETGLQNLTRDEGPVMVHLPGNQSQKWKMVRMEEPQAKTTPAQ